MEDQQIVKLYLERSEDAIGQTALKYGNYLHTIAYHILENQEDSEECVNDTYWKAWGIIPPRRPKRLSVFLGKITRNLSLDWFRRYTAEKRGGGEIMVALEELGDCVSNPGTGEEQFEKMLLAEVLNRFLASLTPEHRMIFMRRYWYVSSVKEIAEDFGITESKVKMSLLRSRNRLKEILDKEGIVI